MTMIQVVGFTLGMGICNVVANLLGAQDYEKANQASSTSFFTAITFGILVAIFGTIFRAPLMRLIGATETILPYAETYAQYIVLAAPFMAGSIVLNSILRGEGKAKLGMKGMMTGNILNMFLDPLFIFTFDMGMAGAALATALSQFISFSILLSMFLRKKSNVWIGIKNVRGPRILVPVLSLGSPTMCRQGLGALSTIALNRAAGPYGDAAIAAMGIVGKISALKQNVVTGMNQGYQPVAGYNYGAKKYGRVYDATKFIAIAATVISTILSVIIFITAPQILSAFRGDDPAVVEFGTVALRLLCITSPICGVSTAAGTCHQSTGRSAVAVGLSVCRQGLIYLPLMLILPNFIGKLGIQIVQPIADIVSTLISIPFYVRFMREMKQLEAEVKLQEECN